MKRILLLKDVNVTVYRRVCAGFGSFYRGLFFCALNRGAARKETGLTLQAKKPGLRCKLLQEERRREACADEKSGAIIRAAT